MCSALNQNEDVSCKLHLSCEFICKYRNKFPLNYTYNSLFCDLCPGKCHFVLTMVATLCCVYCPKPKLQEGFISNQFHSAAAVHPTCCGNMIATKMNHVL